MTLKVVPSGLVCTSTGQLINKVEWLIDSKVADKSLERFHMIKSKITVTYDYFLVDKSGQHIRGRWVTCTLVDVLGRQVSRSIRVKG